MNIEKISILENYKIFNYDGKGPFYEGTTEIALHYSDKGILESVFGVSGNPKNQTIFKITDKEELSNILEYLKQNSVYKKIIKNLKKLVSL